MSPHRLASEESGFALLAVILVMTLLAVVVTEFAFSMRLEASMVRAYRDGVLARNLAEAGIQQAIREILSDANVHGLDESGQVTFYTVPAGSTALKQLPSLERTQVPLGAGAFSYRISDEEGRLNINGGVADRMQKLLTAIGVDKIERDSIVDAIEDWRDANDTTRTNGAESDDYLKLPVPYRARNGNFQDTDELLQVKGITPEMYWGHEDKPPSPRCSPRAAAAPSTSIPRRRRCSLPWACPMPRSAISSRRARTTPIRRCPAGSLDLG